MVIAEHKQFPPHYPLNSPSIIQETHICKDWVLVISILPSSENPNILREFRHWIKLDEYNLIYI